MGIYDRDYYRQGGSGFRLRLPRTAVTALILINVAVFLVEVVETGGIGGDSRVAEALACHVMPQDSHQDTLARPWMWWQLLTCAFVHDPNNIWHIFGNMLVLFFLGRDVEEWYGTREFIRLYLVAAVFASFTWRSVPASFIPTSRA